MVSTSPARQMAVRLTSILALLLAMVGAYTGFATFQQDLAFTTLQTELSFWGRDNYQPEPRTIKRTGQRIDVLLQKAPGHPDYRGLQATCGAWQAYWASDRDGRASLSQRAVQSQYAALESRPAHRHSWLKMVEYASRTRNGEALRLEAQARLKALQSNEI